VDVSKKQVNINADLGEGAGQDEEIMPYLTSCNIACGGHTGDNDSIEETILLAKKHNVKIGAHPSYPDREHFGRKRPEIDDLALQDSLMDQLERFFRVAKKLDVEVHHIKAHGALYNDAAKDEKIAKLFLNAITRLGIQSKIYAPFDSQLHRVAEVYFPVVFEAFIDRAYNDDLSLVNRNEVSALHESKERAWQQLYEMHFLEEISTASGKKAVIKAQTYCIHGDHPQAVKILKYIREQLSKPLSE